MDSTMGKISLAHQVITVAARAQAIIENDRLNCRNKIGWNKMKSVGQTIKSYRASPIGILEFYPRNQNKTIPTTSSPEFKLDYSQTSPLE